MNNKGNNRISETNKLYKDMICLVPQDAPYRKLYIDFDESKVQERMMRVGTEYRVYEGEPTDIESIARATLCEDYIKYMKRDFPQLFN